MEQGTKWCSQRDQHHNVTEDVRAADFGRKPYLDGLRGVAACVVFFSHLWLALAAQIHPLLNANAAVCVFFVLSSYVLCDLAQRSSLSFPAQCVRRYLRLAIPTLLTSSIAWALLAVGLYKNQAAAEITHSPWLGYFYRFDPSFVSLVKESIYGVFLNGTSAYNPVLWTMRPELIGSAYIFIINVAIPNRYLRAISYDVMAWWYFSDYIPAFAAGALLYEFHADISKWLSSLKRIAKPLMALIFVIGVILCLATAPGGSNADVWFKWLPMRAGSPDEMQRNGLGEMHWHIVGAIFLVCAVLHLRFLKNILGSPIGGFLGRISFVLYLIHFPIICSFTAWAVVLLSPLPVGAPVTIAGLLTIGVVFAASAVTYRFFDEIPTRWSRVAGQVVDRVFPAGKKRASG